MRWICAIILTLISLLSTIERGVFSEPEKPLMEWDVLDYYGYTPMFFLHQNAKKKVWNSPRLPHIIYYYENEKPHKMTMGMGILYSPAFLMAHAMAPVFGYPADGLSRPYQWAVHLSLYPYLLLGWWALFGWLNMLGYKHYLSIVAAGMVLLGTNLYYYTVDEPAMTHAFSFSLVSLMLYLSGRWFKENHRKWVFGSAFVLGIIVLVRPVNALLIALIPLNGLLFFDGKQLFGFFRKQHKAILIATIIGLLSVFPQFLYWKLGFGSWFVYSYGEERFFWSNPKVMEGLFSFRKGWFLYTPLAVFMFIGFFNQSRRIILWSALFVSVFFYVAFSWWCWWYGGAYGQRVIIDIYPWLTLGLVGGMTLWMKSRWRWPISATLVVLVTYNLFTTYQYRVKLIHDDANTPCSLKHNFLRVNPEPQDWWEMLYYPDYTAAKAQEEIYPPAEGWSSFCHSRK
jgi:MFS family permease